MIETETADTVGAFVPGEVFSRMGAASGSLGDLSFAVKDLIDVAGRRTGGGNPDWRNAAEPASGSARVVDRLLDAGATLAGKTITDELAFSLEGRNGHYGIPRNPRNSGWLPGGSSSGSAAAVAAGLVDFSLGTDTGGSVRVPALFCGIAGFRPSHGAISLDGVLPFAPSLDTVGWFARDASTLLRVGDVLLPQADVLPPLRIHLIEDTVELLPADAREPFLEAARPHLTADPIRLFDLWPVEQLQWAYSTIQGFEIAGGLQAEIDRVRPRFAPDLSARFASIQVISAADYEAAMRFRQQFSAWFSSQFPPGSYAILPVASEPFLEIAADARKLTDFYSRTLALTSVAGHAGAPQIQLGGSPISIVGAIGSDRSLLRLANELE